MEKEKKEFRPPVMERYRATWLTYDNWKFLRKEKRRRKKSMQQVLNDLIQEKATNP